MRDGVTVEFDVHFARGSAGRREVLPGEAPPGLDLPEGSVPRVAKLLALAIRCEELVRRGVVADYADLARLGHVTRADDTDREPAQSRARHQEILFHATTKGRDRSATRSATDHRHRRLARPAADVEALLASRRIRGKTHGQPPALSDMDDATRERVCASRAA